jgi:basic membrane protein A and related proteins
LRTARGIRVFAALGSLTLAGMGLVACGGSETPQTQPTKTTVKVGMAYDIGGRGDKSFNDAAAKGLETAKDTFNIDVKELPAAPNEPENDKYTRLMTLCQGGYNPVIAVGFAYATSLGRAAKDCPDTKFAIVDDASQTAPNITSLVFAEEQGSFLVGAAAALKSTTGHIGFIGGCAVPLINKFEAGYIAGAKKVKADIKIDSNYLSTPAQACSGFNDPGNGKIAAEGMYDNGADIVYQAAGGSGVGVFQAAKEKGKKAIGVDSDQYNTVDPALKDVIITSMLKRVDTAVFNFIKDYGSNNFKAGVQVFDLKRDGVGYSTSGGFIDDIKAQLEDYKSKIVAGTITVPTKP